MLNLLVAVAHSLEASFALRTACLLELQTRIRPIYVFDPPGRDISFGAGWAWKSWERETRQQAKAYIEDLVLAEKTQCANIEEPVIVMGDPISEITGYFWKGGFDLLVIGAPFRDWDTLALSRRFWQAAKKVRQGLPLLAVRHFKNIHQVVALTDGGGPAESALGILIRLTSFLSLEITLVGLPRGSGPPAETEALNLERGLAILKEKGIEASGRKVSDFSAGEFSQKLKASDLVVSPYPKDDTHTHFHGLADHDLQAVLLYIGWD
jgi:hypothetical protein